MRIHLALRTRLLGTVASVAVLAGTMLGSAASAQVCPYNSTQGTCACPTSGAGTTCFGGQLFRASDNSCQNDARPCAANQNWNCATTSCVCNTVDFPCGGCTDETSTVGQACSAPTGGQYTNVCGACACPAGTTLCSSSNTCVATLSCPAGTTFNPCTNSCDTPNVLLSPSWVQSGYVQVNGEIRSTAGNLRMESATAANQGDIYMANGKAIRVDGSGVTALNIGNWGVGGTAVDVGLTGGLTASGALSIGGNAALGNAVSDVLTVSAGTWNVPNAVTVNLNGGNMNYRAFGTDFLSLYRATAAVGVGITTPDAKLSVSQGATTGDAMRVRMNNTLNPGVGLHVNNGGTGSSLVINDDGTYADATPFVVDANGNVGIGTSSPADGLLEIVRPSSSNRGNLVFGTAADNNWELGQIYSDNRFAFKAVTTQPIVGPMVMVLDPNGRVGINTETPAEALDVFGKVKALSLQMTTGAGAGRYLVSDASGNATWSTAAVIGGSGTANYLPKFTAASTIGNSQLFDNGTNVGVGTASPGSKLDVNGTAKMTGFQLATGGGAGKLLISDASGNGTWQAAGSNYQMLRNNGSTWVPTSAIEADDTNIGIGIDPSLFGVNAYKMVVWENTAGKDAIRTFSDSGDGIFAQSTSGDALSTHSIYGIGAYIRQGNPLTQNSNMPTMYVSRGYTPMNGFDATAPVVRITDSTTASGDLMMVEKMSGGSMRDMFRITDTGNVGIGTASPSTTLDVAGTIRGSSNVASTGTVYGYNNGSPGFGVYGRSANSYGVYGYTDGAAYGVYGAGGATALSGVYGTTNDGTGVEGYSGTGRGGLFSSGNIGVQASGSNYSVYASGGSYGVYSQGTTMGGRFFDSDNSGYAYLGYGDSGVRGYGNSYGLYGYDLNDYVYGYVGYAGYSFYGSGVFNNYGDMRLEGKHAFRGTDSWLRLNQDGAFTSGTHTPGVFAPGSLNVGGWGGWGNPGGGNAAFTGTIATGGHSPDIYYGIRTDGYYGGGYFTNEIGNGNAYVGYSTTGIQAYGSSYGGYFSDTDGEYAYVGYGRYGIYSSGELRGRADNGYSVYIGGDGAGTDVELGSHSYNLYRIGFWNTYHNTHMDLYARSYNTISTARFKEDVQPLKDALDKTLNLRGVSFTWDEQRGGQKDIGFIAEEVEKVIPEIVDHENPDGSGPVMSLDYEKISALLVEAIREQQQTINELKARVEALESR